MNNISKDKEFQGAWLPKGIMKQVRIYCAKNEKKISEFIEQAIKEALKK